jgi:hypothetical protein
MAMTTMIRIYQGPSRLIALDCRVMPAAPQGSLLDKGLHQGVFSSGVRGWGGKMEWYCALL